MRGSKNAVKFLKVVVFNCMKNLLSLSDLLSVQMMFLEFEVYFFSQKVVLKQQICNHFRLMIAEVNSVFGHFLLDNSCIKFLQLKNSFGSIFIFFIHFNQFTKNWFEFILTYRTKAVNYQETSNSPFSGLWSHIFCLKFSNKFFPIDLLVVHFIIIK